ncbi:MAG: hypothetical protein ABR600_01565 [Actinomycetota bacterium]
MADAWFDPAFSAVALEFDGGLELDYYPDSRSQQQWATDNAALIADDFPGTFVVVRSTEGVGAEPGPDHPSSLAWLEGQDEETLYGLDGQSVSQLVAIANSMVAAST